eukprot:5908982-Amphidinium_carterae.1
MLSGRCSYYVTMGDSEDEEDTQFMVRVFCDLLGIEGRGTETLLHGMDVVPTGAMVAEWPGIRLGE